MNYLVMIGTVCGLLACGKGQAQPVPAPVCKAPNVCVAPVPKCAFKEFDSNAEFGGGHRFCYARPANPDRDVKFTTAKGDCSKSREYAGQVHGKVGPSQGPINLRIDLPTGYVGCVNPDNERALVACDCEL